jgi:hypothetical protein
MILRKTVKACAAFYSCSLRLHSILAYYLLYVMLALFFCCIILPFHRYDIEGVHVALCSALGHLIAHMLAEDTIKHHTAVNDNVYSSNGSCSSNSTLQNMYGSHDGTASSGRRLLRTQALGAPTSDVTGK